MYLLLGILLNCIEHIQGVQKNRAPFHIAFVYFSLFANLNEMFYTLTIKRPKYSTVCYKDCGNQTTVMIYFIKDSIYHQGAKVLLTRHGSCNPMLFLSSEMHRIHIKST